MKTTQSCWQFLGFIFTGIFGVLLHFLYDWTGQKPLAALISGVNESTWEHMKLLFFPMFFYALLQEKFCQEKRPDFWCIKLYSIGLGLALIPLIFYTFNGVFGTSPDWYNITIFFQAAAIAFLLENQLLKNEPLSCRPRVAKFILWGIALAFVLFTWFPPQIPLFQDPLSGGYGI